MFVYITEKPSRDKVWFWLSSEHQNSALSNIALELELRCAEGHGYLFLTPKKPMLLCSHIPPEAGKAAYGGPVHRRSSGPGSSGKSRLKAPAQPALLNGSLVFLHGYLKTGIQQGEVQKKISIFLVFVMSE
jgi:hypothetical protein